MAEINLLPDELRGKEEREIRSVRKKPKMVRVEMSSPEKEKIKQSLKTSRPSLLSRLFAKKIKPTQPTPESIEMSLLKTKKKKAARQGETVFHIPKVKVSAPGLDSNLLVGQAEKEADVSEAGQGLVEPEVEPPKEEVKIVKQPEKVMADIKPAEKKDLPDDLSPDLPAEDSAQAGALAKGEASAKGEALAKSGEKKKPRFRFWQKLFKKAKKEKQADIKKEKEKEKTEEKRGFLDVNLIPEELVKHPELGLSKKLLSSGLVLFAAIFLMAGIYLGITWYKINIIKNKEVIENEIIAINSQITKYEKEKSAALKLQGRLGLVRQLLDNHVYWTKFFSLLEKHTINEVYYLNFSMTGRDKLVISAVGKDYQSVARQLVAFQEAGEFVRYVKIDAASAEISPESGFYSGVNFNINLEFLPDVFLKPIK